MLGCARFIALSFHFIDHLGEKVKINTCSLYHPTGISQQKRSEFLSSIDTLYDTLDTDDLIIKLGSDINTSIGNRTKSTFCHQDGTIKMHKDNQDNIGPFGIDHVTKPGMELTHLMKAKNLVYTTTFFEHRRYTTWRNFQRTNEERAANGEAPLPSNPQIPFQLDHFLTQK
eukprot:scaffold18102_cov32-Attheya_sp.AAC.1